MEGPSVVGLTTGESERRRDYSSTRAAAQAGHHSSHRGVAGLAGAVGEDSAEVAPQQLQDLSIWGPEQIFFLFDHAIDIDMQHFKTKTV